MKTLLKTLSAAAGLSAMALFALPTSTAFTTIGGSLALSATNYQRDFRVYNNTTDSQSNDDQSPDASHPGAFGAVKAIWKAGETWNSDKDGGRGFDAEFQGETNNAGGGNDNVISWESSSTCSGGVLAYMNPGGGSGISNGWTIKFCANWNWNDGSGTQSVDIQGVGAHEYGHALGLGHTGVGCGGSCGSSYSTMCPGICGNGQQQRTLGSDDIAGLQSIYGTIPSNKPVITSLSGSTAPGGSLTIHGSNFANTVNVKFTAGTTQNSGTIPGTVFNASSTNGGTQVTVTIPANAQDGVVTVWQPSISRMSNPFPIDIGNTPVPPTLSLVTPGSAMVLGGASITLIGTGFSSVTQVNVGATTLTAPLGFLIPNDNTITFVAPKGTALGNVNVNVTSPGGTSNNGSLNYVITNPLTLLAPAFINNGGTATYSWGGKANQTTFFSVSVSGVTANHQGTTLLLPLLLIQLGNTSAAGLGTITAPINGATSGTQIFTQIWTLNGATESTLEASNVELSTVLF